MANPHCFIFRGVGVIITLIFTVCFQLSVDTDGDLVLERHPPRGLVSESPESSDHDSEEESHPRQPVLDNTESSDDGGKNSQRTGSVTYRCTDTQTRLHDDQELCFITLSMCSIRTMELK